MKKLYLSFKNAESKTTRIQPKTAREGLTKEEVVKAMDSIIAADVFAQAGEAKYVSAEDAYYVETIRTDIF